MFFRMILMGVLLVAGSVGVAQEASQDKSVLPVQLVGHWFNTENNATVGLIIEADKSCQMYTQRLTAARSSRPCKIELHRDNIYYVFLKGADGQCGASADFEFNYLPSQQRLDLNTGGGVNFLLEPYQQSPVPTSTSKKST